MRACIKLVVIGAGLLLVGVVAGAILTLASLLIVRPVKSTLACYTLQFCSGGSATIAEWRGFPFGITESPVEPFQDCDSIDCYSYFHGDAAIADFCLWTLVSLVAIGPVAIDTKHGNSKDSQAAPEPRSQTAR